MKIQLGTANKYKEGYINCDYDDRYGKVDKTFNMNVYPYPFKSNSASYITMSHTLEHIDNSEKTIEELYRILEPEGKLHIIVPYRDLGGSNHKIMFTSSYFSGLTGFQRNILNQKIKVIGWHFLTIYFKSVKIKLKCKNPIKKVLIIYDLILFFANINDVTRRIYESLIGHIFPACEVEVVLKK